MILFVFGYFFTATVAYMIAHYFLTRRSKRTQNSKDVDVDWMIDQIAKKSVLPNSTVARSKAEVVRSKAEVVESSTAEVVESSTADDIVRSKAEVVESSTAEVVESSTADDIVRSKAEVVESNTADDIVRSKAEVVESSTAEVVEQKSAKKVASDSAEKLKVEFHILLNPTKPILYTILTEWVHDNLDLLKSLGILGGRAMATETSVGISTIQAMFTCFMFMDPSEDIKKRLKSIENMIARVVASEENTSDDTKLDVEDTGYIEFHMKIHDIKTKEDWIKLAKFCAQHRIVLLMNEKSRNNRGPTTTYREYRTNMKSFTVSKNRIIKAFKAAGYRMSKVHTETSPDGCDSRPGTDLDWAIKQRFEDAWKEYFSGRMSFNECFRWIEESDFTEESFNPPERWEQVMADWLETHPGFD